MNKNWLDIETLYAAYEDCKKHKQSTKSCLEFKRNEIENLYSLYKDLNDLTYTIGVSTAFVITRPKIREVFAADFRDRIVHHLVVMKTLHLFEKNFIQDTYSCRSGKGTLYGIRRVAQQCANHPGGLGSQARRKGFLHVNKQISFKRQTQSIHLL